MPRKRPSELRLDQHRSYRAWKPPRPIPGISGRGIRALTILEHRAHSPGETARALREYRRLMRDPAHRLLDGRYGCGFSGCCPQPSELRRWLEVALHHLPYRDRRLLGRVVRDLDELW